MSVDANLFISPHSFPEVASEPLLRLVLGLVGLLMRGAAHNRPDRKALRWLNYNMHHAPATSYASFSPQLAATFDSVPWLRALSHSSDGWPACLELLRNVHPEADEAMARRVYAAVSSRTFQVPLMSSTDSSTNGSGSNSGGSLGHSGRSSPIEVTVDTVAVVPLLDMVNHAVLPNAEMLCHAAGCRLEAITDVAAGDEVTISYGDLPDVALLQRYGFALGGAANPIGVRLEIGECSIDVGSSNSARAEDLDCLRETLGDDAQGWLTSQCAEMLDQLTGGRGAMWDAKVERTSACAVLQPVDSAEAQLRSVWRELEAGLEACVE
jgi:hypothetical protein